ncbi:MAG: acetyl-coenzyme a synthetase, partial [Bacteroidota bacterium]
MKPHQINTFEDYKKAYHKSIANPEAFWSDIADTFVWRKKWENVLNWDFQTPM